MLNNITEMAKKLSIETERKSVLGYMPVYHSI